MLGAGLSPAQADLLRAGRAARRACMGKPQLLFLETPYLELGYKSQSILGTFCFFSGKWYAAGQCVAPSYELVFLTAPSGDETQFQQHKSPLQPP